MKFEDYGSVKKFLEQMPEENRTRYLTLLSRFCSWIRKSPEELVREATRRKAGLEKLVDKRLRQYRRFVGKQVRPFVH